MSATMTTYTVLAAPQNLHSGYPFLVTGGICLAAGLVTLGLGLRRRGTADPVEPPPEPSGLSEPPVPRAAAVDREIREPDGLSARKVRRMIDDHATWDDLEVAVCRVRAEAGRRPYAVLLGPESVTVRLAGAPRAHPPSPWRPVEGGWEALRADVCRVPEQGWGARVAGNAADSYLVLGSASGRLVCVDMECAPGALAVLGDRSAVRDVAEALLAQAESMPSRRTLVAAGTLRGAAAGLTLSELLDGIERAGRAAGDKGRPVLLACADPAPAEALRIRSALERDEGLRVLVLGDFQDSRWSLEIDAVGRMRLPGLGLGPVNPRTLPTTVRDRPAPFFSVRERLPSTSRPPASLPAAADLLRPVASRAPALAPAPTPASLPAPSKPDVTLAAHPGLAPLPPRDPLLDTDPLLQPVFAPGVVGAGDDVVAEAEAGPEPQ